MVVKRGGAAANSPIKKAKEECFHARVACSAYVCPSAWAKAITPSSWICHMSNRRGGSICGGSKFMCAQCGLVFCSSHTAAHGLNLKGGPHIGLDINSSEMFCFGCSSQFTLTSDYPEMLALHQKIADVIDQVDEVPSLTRKGTPIGRVSSSDPSKIMLIQRNLGHVGAPSPRLKELARHEQHMTAEFFYDHLLVKRSFQDWKESWIAEKSSRTPRTPLAKFKTFVASFNFVSRMKKAVSSSPNALPPSPWFLQPGMQGLQNLGNTCYINSVAQCLGHVNAFRMAILEKDSDIPPLRRCLSELMLRMWTPSTKRSTIVPNHLLSEIQKNPQFAGFRQQDAHDLFLRFMDDAGSSAAHLTKVSNATQVRCNSCKFIGSERVESDPSVSLSLSDSVEFGSKGNAVPASSRLSLSSLIQHHWQQTETLADYKCEGCKKIGSCVKCCTLKFAPVVLVLHIKRFAWVPKRGCVKVSDLFTFPIDNMQFGGKSYFLRGMVIHHGARLESGHYTACCRCNLPGASENKWYMFDDSRVSPVPEIELQNMQPYILFYCESSLTRK